MIIIILISVGNYRSVAIRAARLCNTCTQENLFKILLNQPEIILYLPFSDWFGSKRTSDWIQVNRKMVNTIWYQFDLNKISKWFLCVTHVPASATSNQDFGKWRTLEYIFNLFIILFITNLLIQCVNLPLYSCRLGSSHLNCFGCWNWKNWRKWN